MINTTYSTNEINPRVQPLFGYDKPNENSFSLINKYISSWSFDGLIPLKTENTELWNKETQSFNLKAGDYIYLFDEETSTNYTRSVISIELEDGKTYSTQNTDPAVPIFDSNVFINYLDENGLPKVYTIITTLDEDGYPDNRVSFIKEDWANKNVGTSGWSITSSGNAIFNDVAVRGTIEALAGNFSGNLTVNNGTMRLGANVSPSKQYTIVGIQVIDNQLYTFVDGSHSLLALDLVKIYNSNSYLQTFPVVPEGEETVSSSPLDINGEHVIDSIDPSNGAIIINVVADDLAYTTVNGIIEFREYNSGIFINDYNYWYDDGHFEIGNIDAGVSWNPDTSVLNVTGSVTASKIRGSDVYADSLQLGGSEFGWVSSAGDIFSGTAASTSYLKSGFYSNPVTSFEQELNADGTVKRTDAEITGNASISTRSLYVNISNLSGELKKGYQIKVQNEYLIVDEVLNSSLIKLKYLPKKFYQDEPFTTWYTVSTISTQFEFFTELEPDSLTKHMTFEGPAAEEYHATNVEILAEENLKTLTTRSIPPIQTVDGKPKTYVKNSLYSTLTNVDAYRRQSGINRIVSSLKSPSGSFYDTKIFVPDASAYFTGDLIYLENIPSYYSELYSLNNSYFPIIEIGTGETSDPDYGDYLFVYADGYLSFTGSELSQEFTNKTVSSIEIADNIVTLTVTENHHYDVGQVIDITLNNVKKIGETINFYIGETFIDSATITSVVKDDIDEIYQVSYIQNLTDLIKTSVSGTISSLPTIDTKNWDKTYGITIGDSKPDNAPFQIDQFGENVKIKNLEVTGNVTGFYYDIIELDDFSAAFDGRNNTFLPRYNQEKVVLDNPLRLMISLNGVVQSAFIKHKEYVWQTGFLGYKGYTLDDDGKIKFSESPPPGSTINARVLPGPTKNKKSRIYPFKAVDVALG